MFLLSGSCHSHSLSPFFAGAAFGAISPPGQAAADQVLGAEGPRVELYHLAVSSHGVVDSVYIWED